MSNERLSFSSIDQNALLPRLSYLTQSQYGPDWNSMLHTHPITEVLFMTEGSGKILFDKKAVTVRRGDMVLINPMVPHTESSSSADPLSYLLLGIDKVYFTSLDAINPYESDDPPPQNMAPQSAGVFHMQANFNYVRDSICRMQRELEEKSEFYEITVQNLLSLFIVFLMRNTSVVASNDSVPKMSRDCALIKRYIDANYTDNYSLEELAEKIYVTKFHLIHLFKKYLGVSPGNYILQKRLTESKQLLQKTDLNISDISKEIGFSNPNHFAQAFKKSEGITPTQFRKKQE